MQQPIKPIKRSAALAPLSKDHHEGLLLCWKIRYGLQNHIAVNRIANYVCYFYEKELMPHFRQEEEYIFSLLPDHDAMKTEALAQHHRLNGFYETIKSTAADQTLLRTFSDALNHHIRFEERQLFPHIEQHADPALFGEAGKIIAEIHNRHECLAWPDEFWIKKK